MRIGTSLPLVVLATLLVYGPLACSSTSECLEKRTCTTGTIEPAKPEAGAAGAVSEAPIDEGSNGGRTDGGVAGSGGEPLGSGGVGESASTGTTVGAACQNDGERVCGRTGYGSILECTERIWALVEACVRGTRCESEGPRCAPIDRELGACDEDEHRDAEGTCVPKLPLGETCTGDEQCITARCVDSVCCESACAGQCQMCDSTGSCVRIQSAAPVGGRKPCANAGAVCGGVCDGSSDQCVFAGSEQVCVDAACNPERTSTTVAVCDGGGQCSAPTTTNCGPSNYCSDGDCVTKTVDGGSCESAAQCQSGNCSEDASTGNQLCCANGYANCGSCVDLQADQSNCGLCSNACAPNQACQDGLCKCIGYAFPATCNGCGTWDFESGTTEGWVIDTSPNWPVDGGENNGATNVTSTQTHVHAGNHALAVAGLANAQVVSVAVPLCESGNTINMAGYTMSAWVYLTGTELAFESFMFFDAWGASDAASGPVLTGSKIVEMNTWHRVEMTFSSAVQASHVAIRLNPELSWTGIVYIDEIQLSPP